jgi:hypothetical protein
MSRLAEGWYLMNISEVETELSRHQEKSDDASGVVPLTIEEAISYRNQGNLPDQHGRTLRLVLHINDRADLQQLDAKRLLFEPDHHELPKWRRPGSVPINVIPLHTRPLEPAEDRPWWRDPELGALEDEWKQKGTVSGLRIPEIYRGFIYKTIVNLRAANIRITPESVANSIARWLPERDAQTIKSSLQELNSS